MKNPKGKYVLQGVLLLGLILFAFYFALKEDMSQVLHYLAHVSIWAVLIVVVLGSMYYVLQGLMFYWIGKKYQAHLSLYENVENAYVGAFFNGVTPLGGGQVAQTYIFHKKGITYANIASILWKDFFLYQCVVVVFALFILGTHISYTHQSFPVLIWLVYLGLGIDASVIVLLWTMSHFPKLYAKLSACLIQLLYRIHLIKNKELTQAKWKAQIEYFASEIASIKQDKKLIVKGILINLLRQCIYYSIPLVIGIGLGLPLSLKDVSLVWLLSCCIQMLNALTPLPGDTGWCESMFIILFSFVFQRSYASSIMILWRMATYYVPLLIGGTLFFVFKMKSKKRDIQPAQ